MLLLGQVRSVPRRGCCSSARYAAYLDGDAAPRPGTLRLAGLAPEERILANSDDVLRALPDTYLATLSAPTRAAIRARIGR
jgi:hypothetical protein